MKRFVPLIEEDIQAKFAWWDTTLSEFETHSDSQAWSSWEEFEEDCVDSNIERYHGLFQKEDPNYKEILKKYITHIQEMEGTDFLFYKGNFTKDELLELKKLDTESDNERT